MQFLAILLLCAATVVLVGLQQAWGWLLLCVGAGALTFCGKRFAKDVVLLYLAIAILGVTPITTDISYAHMIVMGTTLTAAVALPYAISRWIYGDRLVRFTFHHGRHWFRSEILYILVTAAIAYVLLPFYLRDTGAYRNWTVEPGLSNMIRLFIGTNALGLWDELFFVSTVLGILRRFLSFHWANIVQAILFTSFLYELGFTGWGVVMIYLFALLQGYVFRKTESLLYVITIHLTLDLILFLALIHAHHPSWMPVFLF